MQAQREVLAATAQIQTRAILRILILRLRGHTHPRAGGAEVFTHEVAKRRISHGHAVTFIASNLSGAAPIVMSHVGKNVIDILRVRQIKRRKEYRELRDHNTISSDVSASEAALRP